MMRILTILDALITIAYISVVIACAAYLSSLMAEYFTGPIVCQDCKRRDKPAFWTGSGYYCTDCAPKPNQTTGEER